MAAPNAHVAARRPLPGGSRPSGGPATARTAAPDPEPAPELPAGALVTAARMGRILSRSGWRLARQLPGGRTLEREAQRLQKAAISELKKLVELPQSYGRTGSVSAEEQRAVLLIQDSRPGEEPLRSAMSELLQRSVESDHQSNREYLFGTIISQLVPDEARILAALAAGATFASIDVVIKPSGRGLLRTQLAHASSVGRAVGVSAPENVPTYLSRLAGFGLIGFDVADDALSGQYEALGADPIVVSARAAAAARKLGSVRMNRRTLRIAPLGSQFWAACDPSKATGISRSAIDSH